MARFSVAIRRVREDGSEVPVDGELAAALAGPAEQFAGLLAWAADEAGYLDHGEREEVIREEGRELQRRLLEATKARGLKVPVLIDYIHVSGYLGKAATSTTSPATTPPAPKTLPSPHDRNVRK